MHEDVWRSGSACDSSPQGRPFESGHVHVFFFALKAQARKDRTVSDICRQGGLLNLHKTTIDLVPQK